MEKQAIKAQPQDYRFSEFVSFGDKRFQKPKMIRNTYCNTQKTNHITPSLAAPCIRGEVVGLLSNKGDMIISEKIVMTATALNGSVSFSSKRLTNGISEIHVDFDQISI